MPSRLTPPTACQEGGRPVHVSVTQAGTPTMSCACGSPLGIPMTMKQPVPQILLVQRPQPTKILPVVPETQPAEAIALIRSPEPALTPDIAPELGSSATPLAAVLPAFTLLFCSEWVPAPSILSCCPPGLPWGWGRGPGNRTQPGLLDVGPVALGGC